MFRLKPLNVLLPFGVLAFLAGCATQSGTNALPHAAGISGSIHGGQQPVAFSTIQLYTVGTTGDGSAATPLLTQTVTSDAGGNFTLSNLYNCTGATQVYLTATGGQVAPGVSNPNLSMMAALGQCSSLGPSTFISLNEVTTVAAVSSLATFMTGYSAVGSNNSDVAALNSAFALAAELANTAIGQSPGNNVPAGMAVPSTLINTLANVVAACINSPGGVANDGSPCGKLFALTKPSASSAPTDTIGALLYLARNPALNTPALFNLITPAAPFQPQAAATPQDFDVQLLPASLLLNPSSVSFPAIPLGGVAQPVSVSLTNTTATTITVDSINTSANFQQTNNCPAALPKGSFCTVQVTFSPTAVPAQTGVLSLNAAGTYTSIPLSGSGVASSNGPVTLSTTSLTFYQTGVAQPVTLTNYGTNPLGISAIQFSSPNYTQENNCGSSLSGQSICTIYVSAGPAMGTFTGTMTIIDSDITDPQTVSLATNASYKRVDDFGIVALHTNSRADIFYGGTYIGTGSGYDFYDFPRTLTGNTDWFLYPSGIDNCPIKVPAQSNPPAYLYGICRVIYLMNPQTPGPRFAHLVSTQGDDVLFTGYGAGSAPDFFFTTSGSTVLSTVDFGSGVTGSTYTKNLYIPNASTATITLTSATPTLTGGAANNGDFSAAITNCSTPPLSMGPTAFNSPTGCNLTVKFQPTALGPRSATLTVSATGGPSHSLYLTGNGTDVAPSAPAAVDFGNVQVGSSAAQAVAVTMPGQNAATAQIMESGSPFTIPGAAYCAQGATPCQFNVSFSPAALGSAQAHLVVTDPLSGLTSTTLLTGVGGVPTVSFSPSSLTFIPRSVGNTSIALPVTLTNMGNAPLVTTSISIGGTNPGDFAQTNNCPASLAPNASCTISVTNTPTFVGPSSASVVIVSNSATSPDAVSLSGTGN